MNRNQKYFFDFNLWYKNLLIIHLVIIGASVVMSIGSLIMMDISKIQFSNPENRPIILSMAGLVVVFFLAARYIYHRGVNGIIKAGRNKKQSEKLYGIYIARLALIEAGALISLVLFFVYAVLLI